MRKENDGYYRNNHACFLLQYHLVLVTKYRHPVICGNLEMFLKAYTQNSFEKQGMVILGMECMPDHVHILFESPPDRNLSVFINAFKSASSRLMQKEFRTYLSRWYWKPYFWSLTYFLGTVSEATTVAVERYIHNQKKR